MADRRLKGFGQRRDHQGPEIDGTRRAMDPELSRFKSQLDRAREGKISRIKRIRKSGNAVGVVADRREERKGGVQWPVPRARGPKGTQSCLALRSHNALGGGAQRGQISKEEFGGAGVKKTETRREDQEEEWIMGVFSGQTGPNA